MSRAAAVEALLFATLELGSEAERAAYLDAACAGDAELRRQVEKLLKAHANVGDFRHGQAGEEAELDHLGLDRIMRGETGQSLIKGRQVLRRPHHRLGTIQVDAPPLAAMFVPLLAAGVLHQDAAHGLGTGGEEMATMVPVVATGGANEPEVGFVNESRWLQGVPRRLVGRPGGGEAAQLVVDQRQEPGGGVRDALADCVQQLRDFAHVSTWA